MLAAELTSCTIFLHRLTNLKFLICRYNMDPAHGTDQDQENILHGMIRENELGEGLDVTRTFLNDSGEGDESLNRGDGPEAWNGGEADEGEGDEGEGDGEPLAAVIVITVIEMQLSIYIHAYINTSSSFRPPDRAILP